MTDGQVRAIHAVYLRGWSIDTLAGALGFKGSDARREMLDRGLPLERVDTARRPAKTAAQAERYLITALLLARIDQLRDARGLTIEQLAHASGLSMSTLKRLGAQLSDPRLTTFLKLCSGLGVTPSELAGDLPLPTERRRRGPQQPADPRQAGSSGAS